MSFWVLYSQIHTLVRSRSTIRFAVVGWKREERILKMAILSLSLGLSWPKCLSKMFKPLILKIHWKDFAGWQFSLLSYEQAAVSLSSIWSSSLLIYSGNQNGKCESCPLLAIQTFWGKECGFLCLTNKMRAHLYDAEIELLKWRTWVQR